MANTKLLFYGSFDSETVEHSIECRVNGKNTSVFIGLDFIQDYGHIELDRSTAIKFVKELKRQIALIENNG